ncbi:hypothetical protein [Oryzobacter telluris]|uniref:hypothetical protein n=1 Tax=Oryzobacter telluris TaxID=3149179 RepID=UPI00370D3FE8
MAALLALTAGVAGTAQAAKGGPGKPPKGGTSTTIPVTPTTTTTVNVADVQSTTCPKVMDYASCGSMNVTVANLGATGFIGNAGPANNAVTYNTYYTGTATTWAAVVAHEAGGHVDAWNEIVAKVGTAQAWTDYYDLDYFGELWAEGRYRATKGTTRDFTRSEGKETYLDCVGPVAHGYTGNYLTMWGYSGLAAQQGFCASGTAQVMSDALTKVRPS